MANSTIENIKKDIDNAENILDIAYPAIREGRIILKSLNELGKAANSLLPLLNKKEIPKVKKIIELVERRKKSPMEFSRKNRAVIMQENLETESITPDNVRRYILDLKEALKSIENSQKTPPFSQN